MIIPLSFKTLLTSSLLKGDKKSTTPSMLLSIQGKLLISPIIQILFSV